MLGQYWKRRELPEGNVELCGAPSCCHDQSRRLEWRSDRWTCDGALENEKKKKKPKNFIFKLKKMEGNSKCKEIGIFELFEHKKSRARHVAHFPSI
jgi:hypothetical protein